MFLRELHVLNLGAIRSASLSFDASTTLIGESDCGKGSLFRALELVLGGRDGASSPTASDLRRASGEGSSAPLRVELVFEEQSPGDWDAPCHATLREHVGPPSGKRRRLVLAATAARAQGGHAAALDVRVDGLRDRAAQHAVVAHVRAMTPLIRVAGGRLTRRSTGDGGRTLARVDDARAPARIAALAATVVRCADELLAGTAEDPESALERGAEAARELLARSPRHFDPVNAGFSSSVMEILGWHPAETRAAERATGEAAPSLADRLGTLLVTAAVLGQLPRTLAPGVEPIWVIEDPEAHLHPMTLVSTRRMLERIRWQKIVTTQSGDLLSALPLSEIRRLVRHDGDVVAAGLRPRALSQEDLRRVGYHLRLHRGVAMFARVWLLVEGESELWILPQIARVLGYDLALEGICCVGFAQCGIKPLVRTARGFGIEWHVLADGDHAGLRYAESARPLVRRGEERERVTLLPERDIEHCFWHCGHSDAILRVAGLEPRVARRLSATRAIAMAVERRSKPFLALSLVEAVVRRGPHGVPEPLARLIETCVALARTAPARALGARAQS